MAPGGIVDLHDSHSMPARPLETADSARYTREVILKDPTFELVETKDSLTAMRRRS